MGIWAYGHMGIRTRLDRRHRHRQVADRTRFRRTFCTAGAGDGSPDHLAAPDERDEAPSLCSLHSMLLRSGATVVSCACAGRDRRQASDRPRAAHAPCGTDVREDWRPPKRSCGPADYPFTRARTPSEWVGGPTRPRPRRRRRVPVRLVVPSPASAIRRQPLPSPKRSAQGAQRAQRCLARASPLMPVCAAHWNRCAAPTRLPAAPPGTPARAGSRRL